MRKAKRARQVPGGRPEEPRKGQEEGQKGQE